MTATRNAWVWTIGGLSVLLALAAAYLFLVTPSEEVGASRDASTGSAASTPTTPNPAPVTADRSVLAKPSARTLFPADRAAVVRPGTTNSQETSAERSTLANDLNQPERTGLQDAEVVMSLCNGFRERFGGYPVGEDNATVVRALTGANPERKAFLPPDHPAIDAQGRLVDRWRQPFFFHLLDRNAMEVRSAGPDQEMYTPDDLIVGTPQPTPAGALLPAP